ncbi:hypothetical protein NEUTE1DRAFT_113495 [Neurospora tetrasperma FGSC 2508]|uniref:Uncharacterized protein n=1 Tax=Neurospora tetrasperma (strain FGSC 2508 / ATCC MYA-4615 / P0657) TaxID=510951 RepID=F8MYM3_NEUT8|nr:uncharacterized protein NEUTE1DRAFT_113495 [Neurospora tetrasperma FGSC 2508]EGO51420.1 hypothetical protein NEUTE1DRAFT_113495 [Neurospora tetrasperma FGSC 2508]EGZ78606.1 hypothetical protein NEUTE2DRAFT_135549 [Neurospora tetrasperma FGSC 2509]
MVQVGWGWAEDVMEMCGGCCGGQAEEDRRKDAQKPGNGYMLLLLLDDDDDDDDDDEAMACKGSEIYSSLTMYVPMRFRSVKTEQPGYVRRGNKGIVDVRSRLNDGTVLEEGIGRSKGLGCAAITIQSELMEMVYRVKFLFGGFRAKLDDGMSTWSENGSVPAAAAAAAATATATAAAAGSSTMRVGGEGRWSGVVDFGQDTTKPTLTGWMGEVGRLWSELGSLAWSFCSAILESSPVPLLESDEEPKGAGPGGAGFNLMLVLDLTEGHKFQKGNLKRQAKLRIQQQQPKQLKVTKQGQFLTRTLAWIGPSLFPSFVPLCKLNAMMGQLLISISLVRDSP